MGRSVCRNQTGGALILEVMIYNYCSFSLLFTIAVYAWWGCLLLTSRRPGLEENTTKFEAEHTDYWTFLTSKCKEFDLVITGGKSMSRIKRWTLCMQIEGAQYWLIFASLRVKQLL